MYEEDDNEVYEDEEEIDSNSAILSDIISRIDDELRYGNTLLTRGDTLGEGFEALFGYKAEDMESIEENIISKEVYIEIYKTLKDNLIKMYDKYYGITFEDNDRVDLYHLYLIYQVLYLGFIRLLVMYAIGKALENNISPKEVLANAYYENAQNGTDVSYNIIGKYIGNEDEFTVDKIAEAVDIADPGNEGYEYLFGNSLDGKDEVYIDNEAFRQRIKQFYMEADNVMEYTFEIAFTEMASNY